MRSNKYNVSPAKDRTVNGVVFDSKKEAKRYCTLKLMEKAKAISFLQYHVVYDIPVNGVRICSYEADFTYQDEHGRRIIEDCKGFRTPIYRLKKKLMKAVHGVEITET